MITNLFQVTDIDETIVNDILAYAGRLSRRGFVVNTLGNIAVRAAHRCDQEYGVSYTKHMGISLEEMSRDNVVVTDIRDGNLLFGNSKPSIGHTMNRTIFRFRPDINAVIHAHVNDLIAWFSVSGETTLKYISADTALILSKPVHVLAPNINVETDATMLEEFVGQTNCVIMPNHGVTTFGRDLSEAYHRITSLVAEVQSFVQAVFIARLEVKTINWISE